MILDISPLQLASSMVTGVCRLGCPPQTGRIWSVWPSQYKTENVWPSQYKTNKEILQIGWSDASSASRKSFYIKLHLRTNEDWVTFLLFHMAKSPFGQEMPSWTGLLLSCCHKQGVVGSPHPTTTCRGGSFRIAQGWVDSMKGVTQGTSYSGLAKGQGGDCGKS